jgi:AcrR family transcriptional regulator
MQSFHEPAAAEAISCTVREDTGTAAARASNLYRHRLRLLEGMTAAVARKGYSAVTIADVVAEAGVSKRTFYEHFDGKEACLLACYDQGSSAMMTAIRQQLSTGAGGPTLMRAVLETYLGFLDRAPQMAVTLLIEVQRSGAAGRRVYRRSNLEFAVLIRDSVAAGRIPTDGFDLDQAVALVGGVNELVLTHAEDHPDVPFSTLTPAVLRFVRAVIRG